MVATLKNSFYICTVKIVERHEVAAAKQRFLCQLSNLVNNKRKEWGSSNAPEVKRCSTYLTAPTALSFINVI